MDTSWRRSGAYCHCDHLVDTRAGCIGQCGDRGLVGLASTVSSANGNVVYGLVVDKSDWTKTLVKSTDYGTSWTEVREMPYVESYSDFAIRFAICVTNSRQALALCSNLCYNRAIANRYQKGYTRQ